MDKQKIYTYKIKQIEKLIDVAGSKADRPY